MAVTQNTYTGDGATVLFSFTFPYLETTDIKVSLNGTLTTAYTLANATTIQFITAPANGVAIRIYRETSSDALNATFYPGSAIRAADLNDNFTQNLYVTQEANNNIYSSVVIAESALTAATTATSTANAATSTANSALSTANSAVSTANAATVTANAASSTANTASNSASAAEVTAASANSAAQAALNAVVNVLPFTVVSNLAAIPSPPINGEVVDVIDSTGIDVFSPLTGLPVGFVGDPGIRVKLSYDAAVPTWIYNSYSPNDPDNRYEFASNDILRTVSIGTTVQAYDSNLPAGNTILVDGDVGVIVQPYDADTAKLDVTQTFTAKQTFGGGLVLAGSYVQTVVPISALNIDCSQGNYFTKTISSNSTFTVSSVPSTGVYAFTLEVNHTSGTITWFSGVSWPTSTAPTLTTGKTHIFTFVTDDGGTSWRGAALVDYTT